MNKYNPLFVVCDLRRECRKTDFSGNFHDKTFNSIMQFEYDTFIDVRLTVFSKVLFFYPNSFINGYLCKTLTK